MKISLLAILVQLFNVTFFIPLIGSICLIFIFIKNKLKKENFWKTSRIFKTILLYGSTIVIIFIIQASFILLSLAPPTPEAQITSHLKKYTTNLSSESASEVILRNFKPEPTKPYLCTYFFARSFDDVYSCNLIERIKEEIGFGIVFYVLSVNVFNTLLLAAGIIFIIQKIHIKIPHKERNFKV